MPTNPSPAPEVLAKLAEVEARWKSAKSPGEEYAVWHTALRDALTALAAQQEKATSAWNMWNEACSDIGKLQAQLAAARDQANENGDRAERFAKHNLELADRLIAATREAERLAGIVTRLEFGVYRRTGGKEGEMCGVCYRFQREGHTPDCWLGKALAPRSPEGEGR